MEEPFFREKIEIKTTPLSRQFETLVDGKLISEYSFQEKKNFDPNYCFEGF